MTDDIMIREYDDCIGFCVINLYKECEFSFNLGYLFEWVEEEHREGFFKAVCEKKLGREISWDMYSIRNILDTLMHIYSKHLTKSA